MRLQQIVAVFARHGFCDVVKRLSLALERKAGALLSEMEKAKAAHSPA